MTQISTSTTIVFLLQGKPLFQITTQQPATTHVTLYELLSHILKTMSISLLKNQQLFLKTFLNTSSIYHDKTLITKINLNSIVVESKELFYNLTSQQYNLIKNSNIITYEEYFHQNSQQIYDISNREFVESINNNRVSKKDSIVLPPLRNSPLMSKQQLINKQQLQHVKQSDVLITKQQQPINNNKQQQQIKARNMNNNQSSSSSCCQII